MEVLELNTTLIEAYRDLDHATRAAKDLARRIKTTQQQAKMATELWRAAELKLASLEQHLAQQPPLSLPAPTNEALPASSPNLSLSARIPRDGDLAHQKVATVEACTITDSAPPIEVASPHPQPIHDTTPPLPPPDVREQSTHMDTPSPPPNTEASTQTGPPIRDYRAELKAEIARSKRHENWHKEAMDRLKVQATSREAELNIHAEIMVEEYDGVVARLRNQAAGREAELAQ